LRSVSQLAEISVSRATACPAKLLGEAGRSASSVPLPMRIHESKHGISPRRRRVRRVHPLRSLRLGGASSLVAAMPGRDDPRQTPVYPLATRHMASLPAGHADLFPAPELRALPSNGHRLLGRSVHPSTHFVTHCDAPPRPPLAPFRCPQLPRLQSLARACQDQFHVAAVPAESRGRRFVP
jgi:hypothetical protein